VSYSKGVCQHCGGHIEFPAEGAGQTIACPHCQWNTVLTPSNSPKIEVGGGPASRKRIFIGFRIAVVLVAAAGVGGFLFLGAKHPAVAPQFSGTNSNASASADASKQIPNQKPTPAPDPWHGLKAGPVALEKQGDGRLVFAVGMLRNTSNRERFGVKVDVDVLDAHGEKIGTATDYTQVMEPGKEWKFRAMVTDKKAAKARLGDIKEQD
jgi:hypothetical protein